MSETAQARTDAVAGQVDRGVRPLLWAGKELVSDNTEGCARLESEAQIVDGKLVISLRISTLAHAARHSDYFDRCAESGTPLKITDEAAFAESVCNVLNAEEEDGSTPITRMLDEAFEHVSEWGEEGIEEA